MEDFELSKGEQRPVLKRPSLRAETHLSKDTSVSGEGRIFLSLEQSGLQCDLAGEMVKGTSDCGKQAGPTTRGHQLKCPRT